MCHFMIRKNCSLDVYATSPSSGTQNNEALNKLLRKIVNRQESRIVIVGDLNFSGIDWEA